MGIYIDFQKENKHKWLLDNATRLNYIPKWDNLSAGNLFLVHLTKSKLIAVGYTKKEYFNLLKIKEYCIIYEVPLDNLMHMKKIQSFVNLPFKIKSKL